MGIDLAYIGIIILCLFLGRGCYKRQKEEKRQYKFLKQFLKFLQHTKQFYLIHGMIEDAIYETLYEMDGEVLKEGEKIYEILFDGREEVRKRYMEEQKNPFLKLFTALACIEMQYGSWEQKSRFLDCLSLLKQDITYEIWKREKIRALFSGLSFLMLFPPFFLKAIERWGTSNLPELSRYYEGTFGIVVLLLIAVLLKGTDWILFQLRFTLQNGWEKEKTYPLLKRLEENRAIVWLLKCWEQSQKTQYEREKTRLQKLECVLTPEQFVIKKVLAGSVCCLCSIIMILIFLSTGKEQALRGGELLKTQPLSYTQVSEEQWIQGIREVGRKYCEDKEVKKQEIEEELYEYYDKANEMPAFIGALQVEQNLERYHSYHITWMHVLFFIGMFCVGWFFPNWSVCFEYEQKRRHRDEELIHYETVIIFLSQMKQIDEIEVIEWLEEGSFIYRNQLERSLLSIYGGEENAILELKKGEEGREKERLESIANGLMLSDKVGLLKAFEDFYIQRKNGQEQRKQENEIRVQKYAMLAQIIAFLPLCFIIGCYLILPFLMESLVQLSGVLQQVQY